jgi:hypothetical protein
MCVYLMMSLWCVEEPKKRKQLSPLLCLCALIDESSTFPLSQPASPAIIRPTFFACLFNKRNASCPKTLFSFITLRINDGRKCVSYVELW